MLQIRLLIMLSSAALGSDWSLRPSRLNQGAGEFTWLVELWDEEATETVTYSIVGAIRDLYQTNNLFLALVLGLFSVAFPVFKLCLYWLATVYQDKPHSISSLMKWTSRISKFSMVEVLFLALLILTVKTLPEDPKPP